MSDPFNQLPTDPEWLAMAGRLTNGMAEQLGAAVLIVVMKPNAKTIIASAGVPPDGPVHDMFGDIPSLLYALGDYAQMQDAVDEAKPRQ